MCEEKRLEVEEEEEEEAECFPVCRIVISFGGSEDGGGVTIDARSDGESIEKLKQVVDYFLDRIAGVKQQKSSVEVI